MKCKQVCPKSVRSKFAFKKQHRRCSLCDSLLKTSSSHRYLLLGKSIHERIIINNNQTITYAECCRQYLLDIDQVDQLTMICLKCSDHLQRIHSLNLDGQTLVKQMRKTFSKTKRLQHVRTPNSEDVTIIAVKHESSTMAKPIEFISQPKQEDCPSYCQLSQYRSDITNRDFPFIPVQANNANIPFNDPVNNSPIPYAQFMIESSAHQQANCNNESLVEDEDRSLSPSECGSKTARLTRRQYDFLITLPSQQSLNAFIEASATQSNSRWTWRRTSANSRGYKIYYVCNFSMRRHYHPCPAAMYALFNPEGTISIYSHGQHEHIPKSHLPSTITDQTKEEIYKCLQSDMSSSSIRDHLIRHQLPFGDMKKLNNFIKYHKEILRYGAVTNVRLNGSAYRQPQYWTIRHPSSTHVNTTT